MLRLKTALGCYTLCVLSIFNSMADVFRYSWSALQKPIGSTWRTRPNTCLLGLYINEDPCLRTITEYAGHHYLPRPRDSVKRISIYLRDTFVLTNIIGSYHLTKASFF
jgi:hypothetical protein